MPSMVLELYSAILTQSTTVGTAVSATVDGLAECGKAYRQAKEAGCDTVVARNYANFVCISSVAFSFIANKGKNQLGKLAKSTIKNANDALLQMHNAEFHCIINIITSKGISGR